LDPKLGLFIKIENLGLDKVLLNLGHLAVNFLTLEGTLDKDQGLLVKANPLTINPHPLDFEGKALFHRHVHSAIVSFLDQKCSLLLGEI
jgi:hypothetical protein